MQPTNEYFRTLSPEMTLLYSLLILGIVAIVGMVLHEDGNAKVPLPLSANSPTLEIGSGNMERE